MNFIKITWEELIIVFKILFILKFEVFVIFYISMNEKNRLYD